MAAGFDGYHRKPLAIKEFLEAVQQTLERRPVHGDQEP